MIVTGKVKLYDGENGESVYNLGNYGMGWLVAYTSERDKLTVKCLSNNGRVTYIDSGFNWEHSIREDI